MSTNATVIYPLPLALDARLQKWADYSAKWHDKSIPGERWTDAAAWFFDLFSIDDPMFGYRADWLTVDRDECKARLDRGKLSDLVWQFIDLGGGKWRPKLVGTVTT